MKSFLGIVLLLSVVATLHAEPVTNAVPDPKVIRALQQLRSDDKAIRHAAVEVLKKISVDDVGPLYDALDGMADAEEADLDDRTKACRDRLREIIDHITSDLQPRVAKHLEQLGHDSFKVREQAERDLAQIGRPALAAVRNAAKSDDPEIQVRANRLIAKTGRGGWKRVMREFCKQNGMNQNSLSIIERELSAQFFPACRFFGVFRDGREEHYRVTNTGKVIRVPLSRGGDITSMLGDGRPKIKTQADALAFFKLVVAIRYGFDDLSRESMRAEKLNEISWGIQAKSRYFTISLHEDKSLKSLDMQ